MTRRFRIRLILLALCQCFAAHAFEIREPLPTITLADLTSAVPPEWISKELRSGSWGRLHACETEQSRDGNNLRHPYNARDAAITKRLMDIYSWKTFVALNWPTADELEEQALKQGWYIESSGSTEAEAITNGLRQLNEIDDNVQIELLSETPPFKVGITRCRNDQASWYPLNGSVRANSKTVPFPSQSRISSANCPRWMTWHGRHDVFSLVGFAPAVTPRSFCKDNPLVEQNTLSVSALADFNHMSHSQVGGNINDPLIDQNGNKVYYGISMNDVSYCTLKKISRHAHESDFPIPTFPAGEDEEFILPGATELKFAWKVLVPGRDDPGRFITMMVNVPNENDLSNRDQDCDSHPEKCSWTAKTVGLIGLHIVHKSKEHMEWIWSTFEQIDNDPDERIAKSGLGLINRYSFYGNGSRYVHNALAPTELTRTQEIAPDTAQLNAEARRLLRKKKSVLQYYQLVGTQYDPCNYDVKSDAVRYAVPQVLRNTVIEPYIPQNSSCMGCHSAAKLSSSCCVKPDDCPDSDFSFLASGLNCVFTSLIRAPDSGTASHK